jgi:hypothetical protein
MDQLDAFLRQLPTMLEEAGQVSAPEKLVSYTQLSMYGLITSFRF